jgi:hypothetical protein
MIGDLTNLSDISEETIWPVYVGVELCKSVGSCVATDRPNVKPIYLSKINIFVINSEYVLELLLINIYRASPTNQRLPTIHLGDPPTSIFPQQLCLYFDGLHKSQT